MFVQAAVLPLASIEQQSKCSCNVFSRETIGMMSGCMPVKCTTHGMYVHVQCRTLHHAGMISGDMQQEKGRRNWEEETQRRYELEQLAEADRDQRVDVSFHYICLPVAGGCYSLLLHYSDVDNPWKLFRVFMLTGIKNCRTDILAPLC